MVLAQMLEPRPLRLVLYRFGVVAPDTLQWASFNKERRADARAVPYRHPLRIKHQRGLHFPPVFGQYRAYGKSRR